MADTMSINEAQAGRSHHGRQSDILKQDPKSTGDYENDFEGDGQSLTVSVGTGVSSRGYYSLSRLSRNQYKIKSYSSFPNLLSLYETPIQEEKTVEKKERKRKTKTKKVEPKEDIKKLDWEEYHDIRNRQEHRNQRVNAVAREQLDKFDDYVNTMQRKVEKQREERRRYQESLQERLRQQQEMERKKLRLHRGPKHNFVHDRSYLKALPESKLCKNTRLADELQRKGVLRTRADVDKFWSGFNNSPRRGTDIFDVESKHSVNYPNQWIGPRRPEIRIEADDDSVTDAGEIQSVSTNQLPPIKKRKKRRKSPLE